MSSRFAAPFLSLAILFGSHLTVSAYDVFQDSAGNVYVIALDSLDYVVHVERLSIPGRPMRVRIREVTADPQYNWDVSQFWAPTSVTVLLGSGHNDVFVSGGINGDVSVVADSVGGYVHIHDYVAGDLVIDSANGNGVALRCHVIGDTYVDAVDDRLQLTIRNSVFEGDVYVTSGPEMDHIYIGDTNNLEANSRFYGRTVIDTASAPTSAFDVIHFNQAEFWGPLEVRTGGGDDLISMWSIGHFTTHDSVLIETGGGDDEVKLTTCRFNESFTLRTGNQSDFVTLGESSFSGTTRIEMGGADDKLLVEQATFSGFLQTVLDGGLGGTDVVCLPVVARGKTFFLRNFESRRFK